MKKFLRTFLIFAIVGFCMSGCGKHGEVNQDSKEQDCKTAIEEHLTDVHGLSVNTYKSFYLNENGSATATVEVTVALENGIGSMEMSAKLSLKEKKQIDFCSLCDLGVGYNGGAKKQEKSPIIYQDFILRKTEQLTGFVIELENDNYTEREIIENGRTYIDISAFIKIKKMAKTRIDIPSVFQLYAVVNPNNTEDLFIAITSNSMGEIYRYDHTSIPHKTADNDLNKDDTDDFSDENKISENDTGDFYDTNEISENDINDFSDTNEASESDIDSTASDADSLYYVRKPDNDRSTQIGAYAIMDNAIQEAETHKDEGYVVYDSAGNIIYKPNLNN